MGSMDKAQSFALSWTSSTNFKATSLTQPTSVGSSPLPVYPDCRLTLLRNLADQDAESEIWLGEWMQARGNRDEMVIATKVS